MLIPELMYDVFLQVVFFRCLIDITLDRSGTWGHVAHGSQDEETAESSEDQLVAVGVPAIGAADDSPVGGATR